MNPSELENVMIAKQAAQSLRNQWEAVQEYINIMAGVRRQYYLACLEQGFTASEALHLAATFQFPTQTGHNGS